jgi:hypothetical protein
MDDSTTGGLRLTEQERETPPAADAQENESRRGAHLAEQAHKGGKAVVEKYGREYMREIGGRGASAVAQKYGLRFYSEIAARNKGVKKRKAAG